MASDFTKQPWKFRGAARDHLGIGHARHAARQHDTLHRHRHIAADPAPAMRALNRNEQLLALALGGALFLVLNLFGMRWVAEPMRSGRAEIAQLESGCRRRASIARQKFLLARPRGLACEPIRPNSYDARTSRSKFVQEVQSSVTADKLQIAAQQPLADESQGRLATAWIDLDLTVTGRL